jgi:hypothetical protein
MPVVGVNRDRLFEALGQVYSEYLLALKNFNQAPRPLAPHCRPLLPMRPSQQKRSLMRCALSMALSWMMW